MTDTPTPTKAAHALAIQICGCATSSQRRGDVAAVLAYHAAATAPLEAEIARKDAALRKMAQGWDNVVELDLLPPQHNPTAIELGDAARAALEPDND